MKVRIKIDLFIFEMKRTTQREPQKIGSLILKMSDVIVQAEVISD